MKYTHNNFNSDSGGGVGFCGLLAILFIGLKLAGIIHWSWIWVLSPLWIPFLIVLPFAVWFFIKFFKQS